MIMIVLKAYSLVTRYLSQAVEGNLQRCMYTGRGHGNSPFFVSDEVTEVEAGDKSFEAYSLRLASVVKNYGYTAVLLPFI